MEMTNESPLKMMKNLFISLQKLFLFSETLFVFIFCRNIIGKKTKNFFFFFDITNSKTNNYNTHIQQYVQK